MTVAEFKKKIKVLEAETGLKWKIHYKGYKEALESGRLSAYWHKPVVLAEVKSEDKSVKFELEGNFSGVLCGADGETLKEYSDVLEPYESVMENDDQVGALEAMSEDCYLIVQSTPVVKITCEGREVTSETDILSPIFDIDAIKEMMAGSVQLDLNSVAEEPEEETEESVEDPTEERAEEPATEEPVEEPEEPAEVVREVEVPIPNKSETPAEPKILDSGNRTQFASGAVRDVQEGKGRCDLLPLDIVSEFFEVNLEDCGQELGEISKYQEDKNYIHLIRAAKRFAAENFENDATAILEYAKHLEEGAKKYSDRNWEKGIPLERFIDSGIRHWLKHKRGDVDEPHNRAFIWNMLCGAWTCVHHPDLNK